ncbi:hypothetical protein Hanom_Chr14g01278051 [Helianthus anomalus]
MCKEESATPETHPVNIEVIGGLTSYTAGSPASKLAVFLISDIYGTFLTIYPLLLYDLAIIV